MNNFFHQNRCAINLGFLILLFVLMVGAIVWSLVYSFKRLKQYDEITTSLTLPDRPVVAEYTPPVPPDTNLLAALANLPDPVDDEELTGGVMPDIVRTLRDQAKASRAPLAEYIPDGSPLRRAPQEAWEQAEAHTEAREWTKARDAYQLVASVTRDALGAEYARRSAESLRQQIETTLAENQAMLERYPSDASRRVNERMAAAATLDVFASDEAAELYKEALADLPEALAHAHEARHARRIRELRKLAEKAHDARKPAIATVILRVLCTQLPNDPDIRKQCTVAEAELDKLLQTYFIQRFDITKKDSFKRTAKNIRDGVTLDEPLCIAANAFDSKHTRTQTLDIIRPHLPALQRLAENGSSTAAPYLLGRFYQESGADPKREPEKNALTWHLRSVEAGFIPANLPAALLLLSPPDGMGQANPAMAMELLLAAAQKDYPAAMRELGALYMNGRAGEKNAIQARNWFYEASRRGDARAQCNMGLMLLEDDPSLRNPEVGIIWLRRAAEQNDPLALYNLGLYALRGIPPDVTDAQAGRYFRRAAEEGLAPAQRYLAGFYVEGRLGFPRDPVRGYQWAKKAADQNDPPGLLFYAMLNSHGIGTQTNQNIAVRSVRTAANLNYPEAMFAYGLIYQDGAGLPRNMQKATFWVKRAELAGYSPATEWLKINATNNPAATPIEMPE